MNLNNLRAEALKDVFDALESAFTAADSDFYIIGALAKDIWYAKRDIVSRQTNDIDFAVLVGSNEDYEAIKGFLIENKGFTDSKNNPFVFHDPSGIQIDIIPFGEIQIAEGVPFVRTTPGNTEANGFMEVYHTGTEEAVLGTGHRFEVASLPSIVLLKLIAFDDRPEMRSKDAKDIAEIIFHFPELNTDLFYSDNYAGLFADGEKEKSEEEISAIVIGSEIGKITSKNNSLTNRVKEILQKHIDARERSIFIRNMLNDNINTVDDAVLLLQHILKGFIG